ncbi:endonuclease/exonuclease/phosphatase family protein [Ostertagia ostertagi]
MECHYSNNDKATASGGADAPIPRSQGIGGKTLTGQKKEIPRLLTPKSKLRLGSWNVRTAFHCGQKEIIARELSKCRVTVAALSELRISGCGTTRVQVPATDDWMTLYYSGGQEHRDGVGFMLNSHASKCVVSFQPISPRIAVITLGGTVKSHIVSVYAPTEPSDDGMKDEFYMQLQDVLDSIPRRDLVIVTGDLNARTGADRTGWEPVMGRFGVGEMNNNGLRLLSFATFNDLVIGNSLYQHARKHQLTWRNPSGHDSAVLDYVLINSRYRSSLKDVRAMRGPDCGSDHYLLRAVVQLRLQCAKRGKRQPKVDWEQLMKLEVKQGFQIALSNQFAAFTEVGTVDEEERQTAKVITECATQLCPVLRRRTKPWISDETLQLVDKRRKVKLTNGTTYQLLSKELRKRLKTEREAYWNAVAEELEESASKHEYRMPYQILRRLCGQNQSMRNLHQRRKWQTREVREGTLTEMERVLHRAVQPRTAHRTVSRASTDRDATGTNTRGGAKYGGSEGGGDVAEEQESGWCRQCHSRSD